MVWIFSASSSGIVRSKASSISMTSSTVSRPMMTSPVRFERFANGGASSDLVDPPLAQDLDRAGVGVEVVRQGREPHPGSQRPGQGGELFIGGVDPRVGHRGRLVDDQVGGGEPLDQA